jgi:phosphatidylglycerol lysyltransferase
MPDESPPSEAARRGINPARWAVLWRWLRPALRIGIPAIVILLVWRELHALDLHRVREVLSASDPTWLIAGIAAAFAAVSVMGLYDAVAFPRGKAGRLGFWRRWSLGAVLFGWTSFVSMGPLGGPAIRLIAYRRFGLTGPEVARGFVGHYLGSTAGLAGWLLAAWLPLGASAALTRLGLALAASIVIPTVCGRLVVRLLRRHRYGAELHRIPFARLGLVSFFDWGLTLLSFWLLARAVGVTLEPVGAARTVFSGQFAGLLSMIPGGLGSADAVWFKGFDLLEVPHAAAAAAIISFRGGFYLAPWVASVVAIYAFAAGESKRLQLWQRRLVAGVVMLNAILLLLSAATPAIRERLDAVARVVPLGAIEASHALAVATAAIMLFLVRGLLRGYRSAYLMTMGLLGASAVAHLLKGGDYEPSIAAIVLMALLFGVRNAFPRKGRFPVGWNITLAAGLGALAIFLISGFTAFEKIPYRHELWITFAEKAEASRFLRGALLLAAIAGVAIVRQATRPGSVFVIPTSDEIARAEAFARAHADSAESLTVGGADKAVWFFDDPDKPGETAAMFLFQRRGDCLLAFKDPVIADGSDPAPAISAFLAYCDELDVEPVFSLISTEWMSQLHDFGFHFLKVGQEAVVPLEGFSLQGSKNAGFRRTIRHIEAAGIWYEVLQPPLDEATIDQLRSVSDAWIAGKGGHELQFSACYFSPAYLQRNPVGIARDASGRIVAFVNILTARSGGLSTIDFMRYIPNVADNVMDFVLIRTMQTVAEQGARSFSLGVAAFGAVGVRRGSRLVERAFHLFATKAEHIYNYKGLIRYKAKFHPDWVPRYIAFQQPWDWASALLANARLVEARSRADRRRISAARLGQARSSAKPDRPLT